METSPQIPFGELLKTYRKQQGLTQQQLARKLDIHQNTVGAWERGDYLPATRGKILELARSLHLSKSETHYLLEASLLAVTFYWGLPSPRNPFFTGRQEVLQRLHLLLFEEQNVISCRSCALSGMGGMGKTQTAIEYAYRYAPDYAAVLWANAGTEESLLESFAVIARILKLSGPYRQKQEDVVALVLNWLTIHRDWLLILDNVEESRLVRRFVPASRHGSLLLTTRLPTLGTLAPCLELQPLSVEESIQLLLSRVKTRQALQPAAPVSIDEARAAQTIATLMGGLPLALDLAAAYIEESQLRFVEFLALSRCNKRQMLQVYSSSATYPRSVEGTFTLAFERLQQQNPVAADLLRVCCLLAPTDIPEELFIKGASHLSEELQAALSDPFRHHVIFKDLLACALLRRNAQNETLCIHPLVQMVVKEQMPEAVQKLWVERLIRLLDQLFLIEPGQQDMKYWARLEWVLLHAHQVLQQADHWQLVSVELGSLLCKAAMHLFHRQRYEQAEEFYRRAILVQERALGMDHPGTAFSLNSLASLYCAMGRYQEVETLVVRTLSIYEQKPEAGHHVLVGLLENLSQLAYQQERYAEAEAWASRARALQERNAQSDHIDLGLSLYLKANIYRAWGRYEQAETPCQQTLPLSQKSVGSEQIDEDRMTDLFETFLQDCCVLSAETSCRAADLWSTYQEWLQTQEKGIRLSRQAFAFQLKAKGCFPARTNTARIWYGIGLKASS
jgi:transcriptional regulator with XRE-family HTH domain